MRPSTLKMKGAILFLVRPAQTTPRRKDISPHSAAPATGYIQLDEEITVLDVREKQKISNHANTGAYAFASGQLLRRYCTEVLDGAVGVAGEFYLSSVIKRMITDGQAFKGIFVDSFVCVGTVSARV